MKTVNKTFRFSKECARALEDLVRAGHAPSQTALLENLVRREKQRLDMIEEEERLESEWKEAMQSPGYRAEMQEVMAHFATPDVESARRIS